MKKPEIPPQDRIASSFKKLAASSKELNSASVALGEAISTLDAALRRISIRVSAWHQIAGHQDEYGNYWSRDIGYAKVGKQWGIALRRAEGNFNHPDPEEEVWLFNDAPPWMCVESVNKIPDLFETLIKRVEDTTQKLKAKTVDAKNLATAISTAIATEVAEARK